ncbi:hypothetical protein APSETT444_003574 [Aspergillus pseudonomiae]
MFVKPYQELKGRSATAPAATNAEDPLLKVDSKTTTANTVDWNATGAAIGAGAAGFGKFMKHVYKGVIVDIPLAATEGLRAVPRLYGEEVEDYAVRDWKSGAIAGGKNFTQGMREGFTDIFTQTQKGAKEEGAVGMAKGFLKGTLSIGTKVPSAALGLVAYPAHGITKSLHTVMRSKTRKQIVQARLQEGQYIARKVAKPETDHALVMQSFDALKNADAG